MKCKFCGAEMPDEANFCGKCARPLKDNISENVAGRAQNMNPSSPQTVRQGNDERHKNNLGLFSMIIGLISLIFSCMALGFLGIIGIVLGSLSIAKQEAKKGIAITGIVCSAIAFLVSLYVITAEPNENSSNKTYQAEQATETPVPTERKATPTPEPTAKPTAKPTPEPTAKPTSTLSPEKRTELVYSIRAIQDSVTEYSYEKNPYYLEGLKGYIQMFNEIYTTMGADQKVELLLLDDVLKDIGMSKSMRKKILNLEGKNVLEDKDFWRMDEKEDKRLFFSKGNYFEVSSKAKDDINAWTASSTLFYFGDLKDNKPDGEGILFSIGDTGMRILCAGAFKEGRMNGKGVLFSKDSLGCVIAELGNYKNNKKNGVCTSYNNSDMLQIYKLYRDNWEEYKENYYESYSKEEKNKVVSNLFKKDVIAELMYMSICYEVGDANSLFSVRTNYPIIKPAISYKGEYKEDDYSGKGTRYGNFGTLWYQGEFKEGLYHGDGTLYYAFTKIAQYDGEFRKGNMDGEGTLYNTDGSLRKKGNFDNEVVDKENEMAEMTGLYSSIYEKYEEVGLQNFFEKGNSIQNNDGKKKIKKRK